MSSSSVGHATSKVPHMAYHGLLSDLNIWYNNTVDIKTYFESGNATLADLVWDTTEILVRTVDRNFNQKVEKFLPKYADHVMTLNELDTSGCYPAKDKSEIKPVVARIIYKPTEAKGAKAYGSVCMGMLIFVGIVIVLSDVRYFGRVLPIAKRNIKTGMNRLKNMLHRSDMLAGMNQLITLTVSLARNNPSNQQTDQTQQPTSKTVYHKFSTASAPMATTSAGSIMNREADQPGFDGSRDNLLTVGASGLSKQEHCASAPCLKKYSCAH